MTWLGGAGLDPAWHGKAWHGVAGHGVARLGEGYTNKTRQGSASPGKAGHGGAWQGIYTVTLLGMTPHFTIRVWGNPGKGVDRLTAAMSRSQCRVPICEIELDTTEAGSLTINNHRGLEFVPQKMLTATPEQPTLWHQEDR